VLSAFVTQLGEVEVLDRHRDAPVRLRQHHQLGDRRPKTAVAGLRRSPASSTPIVVGAPQGLPERSVTTTARWS
jgi:hypothetical protein